MSSENPFGAPGDGPEPDEDDIVVAGQIARRARSSASGGLGLGVLGLLAGLVGQTGITMPSMIYGIVSVAPLIIGGVGVAAGVNAVLTFTGHTPGVSRALRRGRGLTLGLSTAAILAGVLALLLGLLNVIFVEVRPLRP